MQILRPDTVPLSILDRIKRAGAGLFLLSGALYLLWLIPEVADPAWVAWGRKVHYLEALPPMVRGVFFAAVCLFCVVLSLAILWSAIRPFKAPRQRYGPPVDERRRRGG